MLPNNYRLLPNLPLHDAVKKPPLFPIAHPTSATDKGERPTPRAIREQIVKLRNRVKAETGTNPDGSSPAGTPKRTPKKSTAAKPGSASSATKPGRQAKKIKAEDDNDGPPSSPLTTPFTLAAKKRKRAGDDDVDGDVEVASSDDDDEDVKVKKRKLPPSPGKPKGYSMLALPEEDWAAVKEDPAAESIFAFKEYEEDMKKAQQRGGLDEN